jgi:ketosteroid isomerase-like protein
MANSAPSAEGAEQVKGTYQYVFDNFNYTLQFSILEIEVSGNYAFSRSTSKGSVAIKASGQTVPDENKELFVLEKVDPDDVVSDMMVEYFIPTYI